MNMFKSTLLIAALPIAPVTFSALAQTEVAHVSVSAMSDSPFVVENAIAKLAQEKNATSRKITSIRVGNSTRATAILYK